MFYVLRPEVSRYRRRWCLGDESIAARRVTDVSAAAAAVVLFIAFCCSRTGAEVYNIIRYEYCARSGHRIFVCIGTMYTVQR